MMNTITTKAMRRLSGPVLLVVAALTLIGCNVSVGMNITSESSLEGRTPATFAASCADLGGTLIADEAEPLSEGGETSSCTRANGDFIACDWIVQHCKVECHSTPDDCKLLQFMAYVPTMLREATPETVSHPAHPASEPDGGRVG